MRPALRQDRRLLRGALSFRPCGLKGEPSKAYKRESGMEYRIAVCDDERIFIDRIKGILLDCEIHGFTDSGQLLQAA